MKRYYLFIILLVPFFIMSCNCKNKKQDVTADTGKIVMENILNRTSIRAFTDQPVSADTLEQLLRAGMAAPSARNVQPWHFIAVNDKAKLNELANANPHAQMLQQAPLAIVVCGDLTKAIEGAGQDFWIQDCSAATENILLAVHALGLGAVWTGGHPIEERVSALREILQLPETLIPLCTIVIGHPAEQPEPKDKWNTDNLSYNTFGGSAK